MNLRMHHGVFTRWREGPQRERPGRIADRPLSNVSSGRSRSSSSLFNITRSISSAPSTGALSRATEDTGCDTGLVEKQPLRALAHRSLFLASTRSAKFLSSSHTVLLFCGVRWNDRLSVDHVARLRNFVSEAFCAPRSPNDHCQPRVGPENEKAERGGGSRCTAV